MLANAISGKFGVMFCAIRLNLPKSWYNKLMPKRLIPVLSLIAAVVLLVMLNFTTPTGIGPFGVLIFFAAVYVVMLGVAQMLVRGVARIAKKPVSQKENLYSAVIAFGPIMLLLAQSLGSLSVFTVGLTVVFVGLTCFLIGKRMQ